MPAVLADIWDPARRGKAISLFVVCVFIGPVVGKQWSRFLLSNTIEVDGIRSDFGEFVRCRHHNTEDS
jgi:hypothetical protein